jgi:hypothetical protein
MILFSAPTCEKCTYIKNNFDLKELGVRVEELTEDNAEGLALLAWHGLVKRAEEGLPILVVEREKLVIRGSDNIVKYLERRKSFRN